MEIEYVRKHKYRYDESAGIDGKSIYKGFDIELERDVLLKVVEIVGNTPMDIKQNVQAAKSEVRAMVALSQVRIPQIYDMFYDEKKKKLYIVMEWINGVTLDKKMLPLMEVDFIRWMIDLCSILLMMEKKKIYHLDIKPQNIMISNLNGKDELYLIDFNISKRMPYSGQGTAGYCAPEMTSKIKSVDRTKVDVFSLGVILYQFYTQKLPMAGVDYIMDISRRNGVAHDWKSFTEPKSINPEIADRMNNTIINCMKLFPEDRYGVAKLKSDLLAYEKNLRGNRRNGRRR